MNDIQDNTTYSQRDRSPAFPNMSLESALKRLVEFEAHFKRSPARPDRIGDAWSIKGKAYIDRSVAALKYFGFFEYQGSGAARQVVVSDEGRRYLRAQQEDTKQQVIKSAALRPKQIAHFWERWGADRPADAACIDELTLKNGFSDKGARDFLTVYDATISFAGLSDSDKKEINGDSVQPPAKEQHRAAIQPQAHHESERTVQHPNPPQLPLEAKKPLQAGTRQEIFALDEGDVVLSYPDNLSRASFHDLEGYLSLFLRKAQRRAGAGDFFAEVYASDGVVAREIRYFERFTELMQFIEEFRARASSDILRVHLPARATDEQRRSVLDAGGKFT